MAKDYRKSFFRQTIGDSLGREKGTVASYGKSSLPQTIEKQKVGRKKSSFDTRPPTAVPKRRRQHGVRFP